MQRNVFKSDRWAGKGMSGYYVESGSCLCLCPGEHSQLSWGTASEMELLQLLLLAPAYSGVHTFLGGAFLLLWELKPEEQKSHFCFLNSYQCPPFVDQWGNQARESGNVIFSTPPFPPCNKKSLESQKANCSLTHYIYPSDLYLSPRNIFFVILFF